ncbi:ABC transporter ATP-binding protein/permease [Candidatus Saccharibacteria bacterium]|nr:ABC transporter ATP-binding protein/permease [Candidatus Saccharibacteria bacterium]
MIRLLRYLGPKEWLLLLIAVIFIVIGVWLDLSIPYHLGEITNIVTMEDYGTMQQIWEHGGWMLGLAISSMATSFVVAWAACILSAKHSAKMRKAVYERVGDYSSAEIKKFSVASLITRSTNDITQVQMFVAIFIQTMIMVPIIAVWAVSRMMELNMDLAPVTAGAIILVAVLAIIITIICLPKFKRIQTLTDRLSLVSRENLTGIRVVRAYNAERFEEAKFDQTNTKLARTNLFVSATMGLAGPFFAVIFSGFIVALFWLGAYLMSEGRVEDPAGFFGDIMMFMQYSFYVLGTFVMMIWVLTMLPGALVSAKRINEVLRTEPTVNDEVADQVGLIEAFKQDGRVEFDAVNYKYPGADENVLENIDFTIKRGETVAFIGSTGCGKSTLVNLLARIADPTFGKIKIGGIDIHSIKQEELHDLVGFVPQTATLFSGTIKENIAFGTVEGKKASKKQIEQALKTAQAWDFVSKLDKGLDSKVEQRGKNFSGGQRQRLSIARVLARQPQILIFDDTFSALDYRTDRKLREALRKDIEGATVIIVAQRIGTIRNADQIFVLDKGEIVGRGKHEELLKSCEIYQQIAASQLSEEELKR